MKSDHWVSVGEFRDDVSVGAEARELSGANIPNRIWHQPDSGGRVMLQVPPEFEREARRVLAESAAQENELASLALAYPRPDDAGPCVLGAARAPESARRPRSRLKGLGCMVMLLLVAVAGVLWIGGLSRLANCQNVVLWEVPSPDGYLKASVFRTECVGAAPDVGVSLLERTEWVKPTFRGNLLQAIARPQRLRIRWAGRRTLIIHYPVKEHPAKLWRNWVVTGYGRVNVLMRPN